MSREESEKNEKIYKQSPERYQNLSEKEKYRKSEYGHKWYNNLSEDKKQTLVEYRKRYYEIQKK